MKVLLRSAVPLRARFVIGLGVTLVPLLLVAAGATIALERNLGHVHDVVEEASQELTVFLRLQTLLARANSALQGCAMLAASPCDGFRSSRQIVDAAFDGAADAPFGLAEERELVSSARQQWQQAGDLGESVARLSRLRSVVSADVAVVDAHIGRAIDLLERAHSLSQWEMRASLTSVHGTRRRTLLLIATMFALGVTITAAGATMLARSMLTPLQALERGARRLAAGDLGHRVALSGHAELAELESTFNAMADALAKNHAILLKASVRDGLTDVFNHREFKRCLTVEFERWRRSGAAFCILLLDIDRFKTINDTCGHQVGDDVLRLVAERLGQAVRPMDVVARNGGDEFAVLLPATDYAGALAIAQRVRRLIATGSVESPTAPIALTVSIGIAGCPRDAQSDDELMREADAALYTAKRNGGNQAAGVAR